MPSFRSGRVVEVLAERRGLQRVLVAGDGREHAPERAYVLTEQMGSVAVGDDVVFNTTAVDLGLGTGGWHVVHWNLSRRSWSAEGPGHIMKLRYTSLQADTGAAEETTDPGVDLAGAPVVACTLHSQVPIVAAAFLGLRPDARISYVMTDGAALPLALSDLVVTMRGAGLVHETITAGHAFGGDLEAVSMPSALALAVHGGADLVIVAMGPGVVGTDSALGTTAVEAAAVLDAAAALGGRPVACVRASGADPRDRHRGASHHVDTVLRLTRSRVEVATVPGAEVDAPRHHVVTVHGGLDVVELLAARDVHVTSMGRGPADDPLFFAAAGAAGTLAATAADGQ